MSLNKRVNIGLDEKIHTQAKLISVARGINLNDYLRNVIEESIKKDKESIKKLLR